MYTYALRHQAFRLVTRVMSHQATTNHLGNLGNLDEQWVDLFGHNQGGQLVPLPNTDANAMQLALVPSHHAMGALVAAADRGTKRLAPSHEPEAQRAYRQGETPRPEEEGAKGHGGGQ